jgi:hypothetical protein
MYWAGTLELFAASRKFFGDILRQYFKSKGVEIVNPVRPKTKGGADLIRTIKSETEMLTSDHECAVLYRMVQKTEKLQGDVAEVGVYLGGTAKILCEGTTKPVHLFDTFEGLPETSDADNSERFKAGDYPASYDAVSKYLAPYPNAHLYKGLFPDTAGPIQDTRFAFVYLDVDLYQSTHDALAFFYPRLVPGGMIMSHDYPGSEGVKKAFDEFFKDKPVCIIEIPGTSQCLVVRAS